MLRSGITQQKAWDYIVREHTKAPLANPQTLCNAERANKELAAMKPDMFKVARTTCPQEFR